MFRTKHFLWANISLLMAALSVYGAAGLWLSQGFGNAPASAQVEEEKKDTAPPAIYNVTVERVNATSSVITWQTSEMADSLVNYGLDKSYGIVRDPRTDKTSHKIIIENLAAGTQYFFRITSNDASGNQGISSDFSFTTPRDEEESIDYTGYQEDIKDEGVAGFNEVGVDEILTAIKSISSEEVLEEIKEELIKKAEEVVAPPTIILDIANVEIGTDYAVITWKTDKESNSMVALAEEGDYDAESDDPYRWKEGEPEEQVLEHRVEVTGLKPATTYHFQVSSKSSLELTGYSTDKTFRTKSIKPEITNINLVKIEEESATIRFTTNVPCTSIIEYTNLNTNQAKLEGNSTYLSLHSLRLTNLTFDTYYSFVIRVESEDGEKAESDPVTFITTRDESPPAIVKVNTESTIYPGSENKIQTIASWETDEASVCQLFYHQGLVVIDEPSSLAKETDFGARHVQVVTNFLPSTVYKFWVICNDEAGNEAKSPDFSILTPSQEESIIDIIIKNFESSFGWLKRK